MLIPEINPEHSQVIPAQRKRLGTRRGFIVVKSNCSIQSYVPALTPLLPYPAAASDGLHISGGQRGRRSLADWPEMAGNVIPYIGGEEEKGAEAMKVWGLNADNPPSACHMPRDQRQCLRVPVENGHLAAVNVKFAKKPDRDGILSLWSSFNPLAEYKLPSAPHPFLIYHDDPRPPPARLGP